jgi:hypothetical protein
MRRLYGGSQSNARRARHHGTAGAERLNDAFPAILYGVMTDSLSRACTALRLPTTNPTRSRVPNQTRTRKTQRPLFTVFQKPCQDRLANTLPLNLSQAALRLFPNQVFLERVCRCAYISVAGV